MDALFRTALRLCGGHEADAEDLLQDTALRAFEGYHQLRDATAGRSWLFTILLRTHLNQLRSRRRLAETASTDLGPEAFEAALAAWQPGRAPDEEADLHLLGDRLAAALDNLTPELRSAVWLVDVEGFTQREAAMMHEVPEGTIASRLFRARRVLRAALQPSQSTNGLSRGRRWSST